MENNGKRIWMERFKKIEMANEKIKVMCAPEKK